MTTFLYWLGYIGMYCFWAAIVAIPASFFLWLLGRPVPFESMIIASILINLTVRGLFHVRTQDRKGFQKE